MREHSIAFKTYCKAVIWSESSPANRILITQYAKQKTICNNNNSENTEHYKVTLLTIHYHFLLFYNTTLQIVYNFFAASFIDV